MLVLCFKVGFLLLYFFLSYFGDSTKCVYNLGDSSSSFPYNIIASNGIVITIQDEISRVYIGQNASECNSFNPGLISYPNIWFYPESADPQAAGCCTYQILWCQISRDSIESVSDYANRVQTRCIATLGYANKIICRSDQSAHRNVINSIEIYSANQEKRPDLITKVGCVDGWQYSFPNGLLIGVNPSGLFYLSILDGEAYYLP